MDLTAVKAAVRYAFSDINYDASPKMANYTVMHTFQVLHFSKISEDLKFKLLKLKDALTLWSFAGLMATPSLRLPIWPSEYYQIVILKGENYSKILLFCTHNLQTTSLSGVTSYLLGNTSQYLTRTMTVIKPNPVMRIMSLCQALVRTINLRIT